MAESPQPLTPSGDQPRERRMGGVAVTDQQARDFERDLDALRVKERQLLEIAQGYMRPNRRRDG